MPTRPLPDDTQGRPRAVRMPFRAADFTAPADFVAMLRRDDGGRGVREELAERGGPFLAMAVRRELERDGKRFVLLWHAGSVEWGVEIEDTEGRLGEVRVLGPEENWELARQGEQLPILGPLHAAVAWRAAADVRAQLAAGADPNAPDPAGQPPLQYLDTPHVIAVDGPTLEIAEALVAAGADPARDGVGARLFAKASFGVRGGPYAERVRQFGRLLGVES